MSFNLSFRYIDDVLSLNNSSLGNFIHRIYQTETGLCYHKIEDLTKEALWSCHTFPFLFRLPWTWLFMSDSVGVSRKKQRTLTLPKHLVHAPSFYWSPSCSFTFVNLYVLCWLFIFIVVRFCYLFLDYIILISFRIMVSLNTISTEC